MSEKARRGEEINQLETQVDTLKRTRLCGFLLKEYLLEQQTPTMLLDMDGVVMKGDSLHFPELTTRTLIPALQDLEALGVQIGPATARSEHVVHFLRQQGLALTGPGVLEDGHVFTHGDKTEYIAIPGHKEIISDVRKVLTTHPDHRNSWEEAKIDQGFCQGNEQWQGIHRSSFWFPYLGGVETDQEILQYIFQPTLTQVAKQYGLDPERDLQTNVTRMTVDNLAIVSIKGKVLGEPIHKGRAVQDFMATPWVFIADGFGDSELERITKAHNGFVIGIKGNLDISSEVPTFLENADATLETPEELAQALSYTAHLLRADQQFFLNNTK